MPLLQVLLQLQRLDDEWDDKGRDFRAVAQRLTNQDDLTQAREHKEVTHGALATGRAALRDLELELEGLQKKVDQVEDDLYGGRIRSSRELEDLDHDRDYLKNRRSDLEDRALAGMTDVDALELAYLENREALATLEGQWEQERKALAEKYRTLRERLQELRDLREQTRGALRKAELRLYDELRKAKAGRALSSMRDNSCQTCRVTVPSHKVTQVRRGDAAVVCEGCGRILYVG